MADVIGRSALNQGGTTKCFEPSSLIVETGSKAFVFLEREER